MSSAAGVAMSRVIVTSGFRLGTGAFACLAHAIVVRASASS